MTIYKGYSIPNLSDIVAMGAMSIPYVCMKDVNGRSINLGITLESVTSHMDGDKYIYDTAKRMIDKSLN